MPSIHQYAALAGFKDVAQARDGSNFDSPDRDLFLAGVRPGQVWALPRGKASNYLAVTGSHQKGFLVLNLRADESSPVPNVSLFAFPRQRKHDLLEQIMAGSASMLCCVTARHVDDSGQALSGRELDVTLASLMIKPTHWYDTDINRNYFINVCDEGHYSVTQQYVPSGTPCDEKCTVHEETLRLFLEDLLCKVYRGKATHRQFSYRPTDSSISEMLTTPFSLIETPFDTERILQANKEGTPRKRTMPTVETINSWAHSTSEWLLDNGVRSGMIFPVGQEGAVPVSARLHRRGCGYFHVEINSSTIFTERTDLCLIQEVISRGGQAPSIKLGNSWTTLHNRTPFVQCHCCRSNEPLIVFPPAQVGRDLGLVKPLETKAKSRIEYPSEGELVLYRRKPALYYKTIRTRHHGQRAMIVLSNGRTINCQQPEVKKGLEPTPELLEKFLDQDGLLKKKFDPCKWHSILTVGSRLRVRPGLSDEALYKLSNQMVTIAQPPFRAGDDYNVRVLESEMALNLRTDLLPRNTLPLAEGMELTINDRDTRIVSITDGLVFLRADKGINPDIPEAALQIMFQRGLARIKQVYTIDSLI